MKIINKICILSLSLPLVSYADPYTWTASYTSNTTNQFSSKTVTNPNGNVKVYQSIVGLNKNVPSSVATTGGLSINSSLNALGIPSTITQNGLSNTFSYNEQNRVSTQVSPELGNINFQYYAGGKLKSQQIENGSTVEYTYDGNNNLTSTTYKGNGIIPDANTVVKTYDQYNHLLSEDNGIAGYTYTYDKVGNLITATYHFNQKNYVISYTYDGNNKISSITYPDGIKLDYAPNAYGQQTHVQRIDNGHSNIIIGDMTYSLYQKLASYTFQGNYVVHSFDPMGRIIGVSSGTGAPKTTGNNLDLEYTYDGLNNVLSVVDKLDPSQNRTFTYDADNRLITAKGSWGNGSYTYDGNNNITQATLGNKSETYSYTNNKLQSLQGTENRAFGYDGDGNIIKDGDNSFVYNAAKQMISATTPQHDIKYTYDASGHVVTYTEDTKQPVFTIYDDLGDLLYRIDPNTGITKDYVYASGKQIAILSHNTSDINNVDATYYVNDPLGSPALKYKNSSLVWHRHYEPYGKEIDNKDPETNHTSFTGQRLYGDLGLVHMNARFYDPVVGRFTGFDPRDVTPDNVFSFNRYAYANNNPMRYKDPSGLSPFDFELSAPIGFVIGSLQGMHEAGISGFFIGGIVGAASAAVTEPFSSEASVTATLTVMGLNSATSFAGSAAINSVKSGKFSINDFNSALSFKNLVSSIGGASMGSVLHGFEPSSNLTSQTTNIVSSVTKQATKEIKNEVVVSVSVNGITYSTGSVSHAISSGITHVANNAANKQVAQVQNQMSQAQGMGAHSSGSSNGNGSNAGHPDGGGFF
jgi:RHS repeat-associated protein